MACKLSKWCKLQTILIAYVYPAWSLHPARPQQSRASCLTPGELRKFQWFWDPEIQIPPGKDPHVIPSRENRESWVPTHRENSKGAPFFWWEYVILLRVFNISRTRTFCVARFFLVCILRSRTMFPAPSFWGYIYITDKTCWFTMLKSITSHFQPLRKIALEDGSIKRKAPRRVALVWVILWSRE